MIEKNFIRDFIERIGMDADGALIGAIGAVVATIGKVNGLGWKEAAFLIVGGLCISGYIVPALEESTDFGPGVIFFCVFILGAISQHVYKGLDAWAPAILKVLGEYFKGWLEKKGKS